MGGGLCGAKALLEGARFADYNPRVAIPRRSWCFAFFSSREIPRAASARNAREI